MGDRRVSLARAHAPKTSAASFSNLWWSTQKTTNENQPPSQGMGDILIPKDDLRKILQDRRKKFVEAHFEQDIRTLSDMLQDDAARMDDSPREFIVRIPKAFEPGYIEKMLVGYLTDHGYTANVNYTPSDSPALLRSLGGDFIRIVVS
jgi:hypothetical protein